MAACGDKWNPTYSSCRLSDAIYGFVRDSTTDRSFPAVSAGAAGSWTGSGCCCDSDDDACYELRAEAQADAEAEPLLGMFYNDLVLSRPSLEAALAAHLAAKLCIQGALPQDALRDLLAGALPAHPEATRDTRANLLAVRDRDRDPEATRDTRADLLAVRNRDPEATRDTRTDRDPEATRDTRTDRDPEATRDTRADLLAVIGAGAKIGAGAVVLRDVLAEKEWIELQDDSVLCFLVFLASHQVVNHGLPVELMMAGMEVAHEFFQLSPEDKARLYSDDPAKKMRLPTSFNVRKETVHNQRDYLRASTAIHLGYNTGAAGGRGGTADVRGAPAVQDINPGALHVSRIEALGGPGGRSADEHYNHGQPIGRTSYQADRVADGGGGGFVAIDIDDAGQHEQQEATDDRSELVERVIQSMFCGLVPACATSYTLFKDVSDYVRFTIFSGLLFIAAVTYTGMFCKSKGKAALRLSACATVALMTFAVASQLSATDHIAVAAAMGMVTCLIMSTAI